MKIWLSKDISVPKPNKVKVWFSLVKKVQKTKKQTAGCLEYTQLPSLGSLKRKKKGNTITS